MRKARTVNDPEILAYRDPPGVWPTMRRLDMAVDEARSRAMPLRETRYYLRSLPGDAGRANWGIENSVQ